MASKKEEALQVAPVDAYEERPYSEAQRSPEDTVVAEDRSNVDQIPDYHKENPTLKEGPAHDPEKYRETVQAAQPRYTKTAAKELAKDLPEVAEG